MTSFLFQNGNISWRSGYILISRMEMEMWYPDYHSQNGNNLWEMTIIHFRKARSLEMKVSDWTVSRPQNESESRKMEVNIF